MQHGSIRCPVLPDTSIFKGQLMRARLPPGVAPLRRQYHHCHDRGGSVAGEYLGTANTLFACALTGL